MNDFQMDQYFEGIKNKEAPSSLEDQILLDSTRALKQGCLMRKWLRRSSAIAAILLFGFTAFLAGRLSTHSTVPAAAPDMVTIQVPKDFPAWVDAGRFFIQLDMKDRAANAFNKALSMIPKDIPLANQDNPEAFLCSGLLTNLDSLMSQTIAMTDTQLLQYFNHPDKTERKEQ